MKVLLACCVLAACVGPENGSRGVIGRTVSFVVPDEFTWSYGQSMGDLNRRGEGLDTGFDSDGSFWAVGLTWYTSPREMRLLDDRVAPRSWIETERPPSTSIKLGAGFELTSDEESGLVLLGIPPAYWKAGIAFLVASILAWFGIKRYRVTRNGGGKEAA